MGQAESRGFPGEGWTGPGPPVPVHAAIGDSNFYATCQAENGGITCRNSDKPIPGAPHFNCQQIPETDGYSYLCSGEENGVLAAFRPGNPGKAKLVPPFTPPTLQISGNTLNWNAEVPFGGAQYSLVRTDHGRPIYEVSPNKPGPVEYRDRAQEQGKQYSYYLWVRGMTMDVKSNIVTTGDQTSQAPKIQLFQPVYQSDGVRLQWNDTGGVYRVSRESEDGKETILPFSRTPGFVDQSAEPGKTYTYTALSNSGGGVTSSSQTVTVPRMPAASRSLPDSQQGNRNIVVNATCHPGGIFVSWIGGTAPYSVVRTGGGSPDITFGTVNANNILDNHSLNEGSRYTYYVSTLNTPSMVSGQVTFAYSCSGGSGQGGGSVIAPVGIISIGYASLPAPVVHLSWENGYTPYNVTRLDSRQQNPVPILSNTSNFMASDNNPGPPGTVWYYKVTDARGEISTRQFQIPGNSSPPSFTPLTPAFPSTAGWTTTSIVLIVIAVIIVILVIVLIVYAFNRSGKKGTTIRYLPDGTIVET